MRHTIRLGSLSTADTAPDAVIATWFADGFFVSGADQTYAGLIGAQVVGIRDASGVERDVAEIEMILNSVIAVDHANGYRSAHAEVLSDPALMRGLGLADADGLTYRLERDGVTSEVTIAEMAGSAVRVVRAADDAPITSLSGRYAGPNWYTRTGADGATVYLKYSDCVAEAKDLFAKLIAELEHSPAERLIIDIRSNSGGTSVPGRRLSRELAGIPSLQTSGSIFVLISPRTFSSGMMLAVDLMERTPALFAGQAFAQRPDSWGEVERFPLPNSGLMIGHSTRFFTYSEGKELRLDADGMIAPDPGLAIERTFEEYARGIDQVLEAVLVLTSSGRG